MKVSICIPTYEMKGFGANYLDHSLSVLEKQTYQNFEVIISDHSTTPLIENVCKKYQSKFRHFFQPNIETILQKKREIYQFIDNALCKKTSGQSKRGGHGIKKTKTKRNTKSKTRRKTTTNAATCCMCEENPGKFIPAKCLIEHGKQTAHRICSKCWWSDFAKEGATHPCPGCIKQLPLNVSTSLPLSRQNNPPIMIDLTGDD